ncbi:reverse transcriptase domain-containing protein [Tanacetum coccineum]
MKFASSQDDCLYFADHTDEMVKEQWNDTLDHDSNWINNEEEDEAKKVETLDGRATKSGVKGTTLSFGVRLPSRRRPTPRNVIKLLDAGIIYPISDSPWVSLVQVVPKKGGMIVVRNEKNELISQRAVTGWRVCNDYRKLNDVTRKDHFTLPFIDQMIERLAGHDYYCFLDGFSGYFQIPIALEDQEKNDIYMSIWHIFAFETLKKELTKASFIVKPDWSLPFELMCDASNYAEGSVLGQKSGKYFQPIYYASKTMTEAQKNYTTSEKELLAVVFAFDKFWQYLVLSKTIVCTNHSTLQCLFSKQDAKPRLIRWILFLQKFAIEIQDKKGVDNLAVDHLSRLENHETEELNEAEIDDRFPDESIMKMDFGLEEPWFADFANYLTMKELPNGMTIQERKKFFSDLKYYFWDDSHLFKKIVGSNRKNWSDKLDDALWAFRTAFKTPIGSTPFRMVYGKACHLPVKIEHKAFWTLKICNMDLSEASVERNNQLNELEEFRLQAYETSKTLKLFSGKLKSRWSGPFTLKQAYPYGSIELFNRDGTSFKVILDEESSEALMIFTWTILE